MHTAFCRALAWSASLALILSACGDQTTPAAPEGPLAAITLPPNVPPGPPTDAGKPPAAVAVIADATPVAAGGSVGVTATVKDKKGNPLAGRPVTWTSTNGGALAQTTGTTDQNGRVTTTLTVSTTAGTNHVVGAASGGVSGATTVSVVHGPAAKLDYPGEPNIFWTPRVAGQHTLAGKVTDTYGNPVPGHTVTWTVVSDPSEDALSTLSSTTGSNGVAETLLTVGTTAWRSVSVWFSANASGSSQPLTGSPRDFTGTVVPDRPVEISISPENPVVNGAGTGSTVRFRVDGRDQYGNDVLNPAFECVVTWSSSSSLVAIAHDPGDEQFATATVQSAVTETTAVVITATACARVTATATITLNP